MLITRSIVLFALCFTATNAFRRHWCRRQPTLVCDFRPTAGNQANGRVIFRSTWIRRRCRVHITASFSGLTPNTRQGWHIHAYGDIGANDGSSTGGHFTSPRNSRRFRKHGSLGSRRRHWGDLGNLVVDVHGRARVNRIDHVIRMKGILGRGMIIHALVDQGPKAQPSGAAGKRVGQCVIGFANPKKI